MAVTLDFDISDDEQEGRVKSRRLEDIDTFEVNSDLGSDFEDEEITSEESDDDEPQPPPAKRAAGASKRGAAPPARPPARRDDDAELMAFAIVEGSDEDELDVEDEAARARARARINCSDDDDDDDDVLGGADADDDGESDDEGGELAPSAHAEMLSSIGLRSRRGPTRVRAEMLAEDDFAIGARAGRAAGDAAGDGGGGGGGLTVAKLLNAVGNTAEFAGLRSKLGGAERASARHTLPAPAERVDAQRAERRAAATVVDAELSKWTQAVKQMREAESLSFPLDISRPERASTAALADQFAPRTSFEARVAAAVKTHNLDERTVERAEARALATSAGVSAEEARARLAELRKSRDLLFHHERKLKRMHKIKSKAYRKLKRKAGERAAERAEAEQLDGIDDAAAAEARRKLEHQRLVERMTQKHRNTSKWARRMLTHRANKADPATRQAVAEQLQLGEELRRRDGRAGEGAGAGRDELSDDSGEATDDDDDDDDDDDAGADDDDGGEARAARRRRRALEFALADLGTLSSRLDEESAAAQPAAASQGLHALPFMRRGLERRRAEVESELRAVREEMALALAEEEAAEKEGMEGTHSAGARAAERTARRAQLAADEAAAGGGGAGARAAARRAFDGTAKPRSGKAAARAAAAEAEAAADATADGWGAELTAPPQTGGSLFGGAATRPAAAAAAAARGTRGGSVVVALGGALAVEPRAAKRPAAEQPAVAETNPRPKKRATAATAAAAAAAAARAPRGTLARADAAAAAAAAAAAGSDDDASDDDAGALEPSAKPLLSAAQSELVALAFPSGGAEADFGREKDEQVAAELPSGLGGPKELPGWGAWAGSGAVPSRRAESRKAEREAELRAKIRAAAGRRKDAKLDHVQISERRDKKLAKYTLEAVPYPYTSREQYERAIRHPLGKEWNTTSAHETFTQPRIKVAAGAVIEPMAQHRKSRA